MEPLADRVGIAIQVDPDLRERQLSVGLLDDFRGALEATWRDFDLSHPGGETSAAAQARVSRVIRRVAEAAGGRNVVIASHGTALALFLRTIDAGVDFGFWARMSMPDVYAVETRSEAPWSYHRVWREAP